MELHPLAVNFVDVADAYERGRPEYTPAVAETIAAELHISPSARVLDLAAGTGKLTRALLGAGLGTRGWEHDRRVWPGAPTIPGPTLAGHGSSRGLLD